jgi:hypothetical protein
MKAMISSLFESPEAPFGFRGLASLLDHPTAHDGMRRVVHTRHWFSPPSGSVVIDQIDIGDILTRKGKKVLRLDPNFATRNPLS